MGVKAGASLQWKDTDDDDLRCTVWRLSVAASHRKQGIARKLMGAVESWAAAHGMARVEAVTANPQASTFYERCGYLVVRANDWGPGFWHGKDTPHDQ